MSSCSCSGYKTTIKHKGLLLALYGSSAVQENLTGGDRRALLTFENQQLYSEGTFCHTGIAHRAGLALSLEMKLWMLRLFGDAYTTFWHVLPWNSKRGICWITEASYLPCAELRDCYCCSKVVIVAVPLHEGWGRTVMRCPKCSGLLAHLCNIRMLCLQAQSKFSCCLALKYMHKRNGLLVWWVRQFCCVPTKLSLWTTGSFSSFETCPQRSLPLNCFKWINPASSKTGVAAWKVTLDWNN